MDSVESAPQQGSAKKPRSAAQQAAFERCLEARRKAIIEKHEMSKQTPVQEAQQQQEEEPVVAAEPEPAPAPEPAQPVFQQQQQPVVADDDNDFVDIDGDHIMNELASTRHELQELKSHIHELRSKHTEIETDWRSHNVRRMQDLHFV